jgi:hypothetical protein
LLTNVTAINTTLNTITVGPNLPASAQTATPIGTGNVWQPNPAIYLPGQGIPTAALPFIAAGPSLLLDSRQALVRGVQIVGVSGGAGGNFLVSGWDIYNQPMSDLVTVAAGASTGWSLKCFKYIASVTPQFTDAHNYTVGTSDNFGLNYRSKIWDEIGVAGASAAMTSSTGFTAADTTNPATSSTGDVRGTVQVSGNGPLGSGIGSSASNGSISSLSLTGRRLTMAQTVSGFSAISAFPANPSSVFGQTQA